MNLDILKLLAEIGAFVFVLGGIWRDVRATQKDVKYLKSAFAKDRSLLIQIIRAHNRNHEDNVAVPATNGSEA
jgi:hypothetical protein